jgi:hypothetical protein
VSEKGGTCLATRSTPSTSCSGVRTAIDIAGVLVLIGLLVLRLRNGPVRWQGRHTRVTPRGVAAAVIVIVVIALVLYYA